MDSTGSPDPPERPATTPPEDDGGDAPTESAEEFAPEGFERWRRDSALGNVGTGIARGLQNVFAPPPNQPVIVASIPGDPPDPERLQVILDPDDPSKSVALLPPTGTTGDGGPSARERPPPDLGEDRKD
jgi:hypothetical protein